MRTNTALWWLSPLDEESQITDSEFLLGNNTLVAPILEQNARSRNIYLPAGKWKDSKHGRIIQGPKYLREYSVQLDEFL
jgi:alpha-glucosidase (family GH31 glycosyl hydrolase)